MTKEIPPPKLNPLHCFTAEGWSMDLYCKYTRGVVHDTDTHGVSFYGNSRVEAHRVASCAGWKMHRDGSATCPSCAQYFRSQRKKSR